MRKRPNHVNLDGLLKAYQIKQVIASKNHRKDWFASPGIAKKHNVKVTRKVILF